MATLIQNQWPDSPEYANSEWSYYDNHKLGYRLGINLQYYFSTRWAIQGEINYQKMTSYIRNAEDQSYVTSYLNIRVCPKVT